MGHMLGMPRALAKKREKKQNKTKKQTLSQVQLALKCKCKIMPRTRQLLQSLLAAIFLGLLFFLAQTSSLALASRANSPRRDQMSCYTKKLGKGCENLSGAKDMWCFLDLMH